MVKRVAASPNHGERRGFARPNCVILHYTGMPTAAAALSLLRDPKSEVSAHYFVEENGDILQLVLENRRAWHAGMGSWKGLSDINSASIGIEIVNAGHDALPDFPDVQIAAVIALLKDILARHAIPPERVLAHSDIAPRRKRDPGEKFPWERLAKAGVADGIATAVRTPLPEGEEFSPPDGLTRGAQGPPVAALQTMLALYGYGIEVTGVYDHPTEIVVAAFQRRFRPVGISGLADQSTLETLMALLRR